MWIKFMGTKNAYGADIWKDLLNSAAISVRVVSESGWAEASDFEKQEIWVPWGKLHVAQEILRKS